MNKEKQHLSGGRLRTRVMVFAFLVLLVVAIFSFVLTNTVVRDRAAHLEATYIGDAINRVLFAIDEELYRLQAAAADLAVWDDTYAYMTEQSDDFSETSLGIDTLLRHEVSIVVLVDTGGNIIFGRAINLNEGEELSLPLAEYFTPDNPLLTSAKTGDTTSGLLLLPEGPFMAAAHPVLKSNGEGPSRGTLIIGRYIDAALLAQLEGRLQMSLLISPLALTTPPADFQEQLQETTIEIEPLDNNLVAGFLPLTDLYGEESIILRVELPRDIYNESLKSAALLSTGVIILVACSLLFVIWAFDHLILKRLSQIDTFVREYHTSTGAGQMSLNISGNDELSRLSESINELLRRVEEYQQQLEKTANDNYRLSEENRQRYEDEKTTRLALEQEIKKRVEFTRALVHDLKTPITPIVGSLELLEKQITDSRLLELVHIAGRSTANLNNRINDLLDLARAEVNSLSLNLSQVQPLSILREVTKDMKNLAEKNRQTFSIDLPPELPVISTDAERFRRILVNIIGNALKYTPAGGTITVRAREENKRLIVEVQDTGIGIKQEDIEGLFEPYHRHPGDRERMSGLGVGLALARKFMEMQGGAIQVTSEPGKGSTFIFWLPVTPGE